MSVQEFKQDRLYCELVDEKEIRYYDKASLPFAIKTVYEQGLSLNPELFRPIGSGGACELGGSSKDMSYTPHVELSGDSAITYSPIDNVFSMVWLLENGWDFDLYQTNPRTSRRILKVVAGDIGKVRFPEKVAVKVKFTEEGNDLPEDFIEDVLEAKAEVDAGEVEPYNPEDHKLVFGETVLDENVKSEDLVIDKEPLPELTEKDWKRMGVPRTSKKMIREKAGEYGVTLVSMRKQEMIEEFKTKYEVLQNESN